FASRGTAVARDVSATRSRLCPRPKKSWVALLARPVHQVAADRPQRARHGERQPADAQRDAERSGPDGGRREARPKDQARALVAADREPQDAAGERAARIAEAEARAAGTRHEQTASHRGAQDRRSARRQLDADVGTGESEL